MENSKVLHEGMGGEVADRLLRVHGLEYKCRCGHQIPLSKGRGGYVMGYPHEGGTPDSEGEKWWMYLECPECDLEITLGKIEDELIDPTE